MRVLLAGGAGYIGSHTAVELLNSGHDVVVADNYSNSSPESIRRVEKITGKSVDLYEADVKDKEAMRKIFDAKPIDCVIHFAGLKAVGESVEKPVEYYRNNIDTTLTLLE
ncbi:MAG: SDR family NAD(P)-dependent oxidoreductase, partial [Lachnospiraceae bacterium]|nr:SDR family NAD(P)-dependent oxidoreductase [Lachnospiraceae bacterium]